MMRLAANVRARRRSALAEQLEGYAACSKLARSAKTAAGRARFIQMADEYRLATLRICEEPSDRRVGNADHRDGTNRPSVSGNPPTLDHALPTAEPDFWG